MAGKSPKKTSKKTPATKATIQPVSTVTPISQPGKGGESLSRTQPIASVETDGHKREEHTIGVHGAAEHGVLEKSVGEQIRIRAYELFEQRGRLEGYDLEDWARAEEEILSKFQREKSA